MSTAIIGLRHPRLSERSFFSDLSAKIGMNDTVGVGTPIINEIQYQCRIGAARAGERVDAARARTARFM
jgi:hypothetical protein